MNKFTTEQATDLPNESLTFFDPKSGNKISLPMLKNTYQCIVNHDGLGELDLASIIRGFYEKVPRKSIPITIILGDCSLEKNISAIAFGALFNCSQDEIDYLAELPGVLEEIDLIVINSIPKHIRPSTNKQRKFADEISKVLRIELNDEIKNSKEKLSEFISSHVDQFDQFEQMKDEVYSNFYICRVISRAIDLYCLDDKDWKYIFNIGFNIYAQLAEYEQTIIVKDLVSEFGGKYWIDCKECHLSQIILEIFVKLLEYTEKNPDYAEQFELLVNLKDGC
jgi:hypothetical protein